MICNVFAISATPKVSLVPVEKPKEKSTNELESLWDEDDDDLDLSMVVDEIR